MIDYKAWSASSDAMLTSSAGSQYLNPDYLQPLSTSLDSKKSPLALLAQTCSSIGKDPEPGKPLVTSLDKKDAHKDSSRPKSSSSFKSKSPCPEDRSKSRSSACGEKPSERGTPPDRSKSQSLSPRLSFRAPPVKDSAPLASSTGRTPIKSPTSPALPPKSPGESHHSSLSKHGPSSTLLEASYESSSKTGQNPFSAGLKMDSLPASLPHPSLGAYPGMHLPLFAAHHLPMDPSHLSALYPGLSAAHSLAKHTSSMAHSPYMSYTRVKTASGASTLVPVCKDPYCSHCQLSMQSAQLHGSLPCPAGCTQCQSDKSQSAGSTSLGQSALAGLPMLPSLGASHSPLSSFYPPHAPGLPLVCNWMHGSEYCGKRFTSSDDLLQHLRTHTTPSSSSSAADSALAAYAGLGLSAYHSHLAAAAAASASSESASLRPPYNRSLSPSSLLQAASRYHPYKTALSSLSAANPPAGLPLGLPPTSLAFSPYSLYGQRLGAAVTP